MENFEAIENLFYWDLTFHLLGVATPKYIHFHRDHCGGYEQCINENCKGEYMDKYATHPKTLGTFLVLQDGSIGFTLEAEGINVLIENNIGEEKALDMMQNTMQRAFNETGNTH